MPNLDIIYDVTTEVTCDERKNNKQVIYQTTFLRSFITFNAFYFCLWPKTLRVWELWDFFLWPLNIHVSSLSVSLINSYLIFFLFYFIFSFNTFHLSSIVCSLLCYCVRARDHCCVLCDATRGLLFVWYMVHQPKV